MTTEDTGKQNVPYQKRTDHFFIIKDLNYSMKLEGIHRGRLLASSHRTIYEENEDGEFKEIGTIPDPTAGLESISYRMKTTRYWNTVLRPFTGTIHSVNVWRLSEEDILANANRWLFYSDDCGRKWMQTLELPEQSGIRGVLPTAIADSSDGLYVGEYLTSYNGSPKLLRSPDKGSSWETARVFQEARHIHAVKSDPYSEKLWIATGDKDTESMIGYLQNDEFHLVGTGSQEWRTVSVELTPDSIIWGMDCPYAQNNSIFRLSRERLETEPEKLHAVQNPIYYSASLTTEKERLIFFSTGCGSGVDSTAPKDVEGTKMTQTVTTWMAGSHDGYRTWTKITSFRRGNSIFDMVGLPEYTANAYIFLATSDSRGLFINPYNTRRSDGEIISYSVEELQSQLDDNRNSSKHDRETL